MVVTANFKDDKITESGLGTGVIIDSSGDVLTNWHVIQGFETGIIFLKPTLGTEPDKNSAYGVKLRFGKVNRPIWLYSGLLSLLPVWLESASAISRPSKSPKIFTALLAILFMVPTLVI